MSDKLSGKFHPIPRNLKKIVIFLVSMATAAILKILLKRWISIRNIIIYLERKFRPNRRIFVLWRPFLVQNHRGHHSKPKWSPYGAACLTPCKYPFPLKSVHIWIFNDFLKFLYWWPFGKFLKQRAQLWVMIYFCVKFSSAVRFEFNIFCTLVTMATAVILNLLNPQQLPHTTVDIPTKFNDVWWKESKTIFNLPFFVSMVAVAKFVPPIPICLAYLVPLDVDVVPNKFHQLISKPQNYVYTCQTKYLESFIQFRGI